MPTCQLREDVEAPRSPARVERPEPADLHPEDPHLPSMDRITCPRCKRRAQRGSERMGTETPAVGAEERTMAGTQPGKPRMLTQCGPRAPPAVLRDRDTRAPGGRWPAFVGG